MSIAKQAREDRAAERHTGEEKLRSENVHPSDDTPMSYFFNLSYANYLVVNRSKLESMPTEWQEDMIELLNEMEEEFRYLPDQPAINVQILKREPERIEDEECPNCHGTEFELDEHGFETDVPCEECDGGRVDAEFRVETPEEVGIITDPIPHYERTRTRLPLLSADPKQVLKDASHYRCFEEWQDFVFVKVYEAGDEVEVVHHHDHALPSILAETKRGVFDAKVVEKLDDDLYKVEIDLAFGTGSKTAPVVVQVHADQLNAA